MGGRKVWTQETLAVPDLQELLQDQTLMRFANASARNAAIPLGDREEGMLTYLEDTNSYEWWDGAAWWPLGSAGWPKAQLRATANQTGMAGGAWATVLFQTEDEDTHGGHGTSSNVDRFTCPAGHGGLYAVAGTVAFGSIGSTLATFITRWEKNGSPLPGSTTGIAVQFGPAITAQRRLVRLNPDDFVTLSASVGVAWSLAADANSGSVMTVERVA